MKFWHAACFWHALLFLQQSALAWKQNTEDSTALAKGQLWEEKSMVIVSAMFGGRDLITLPGCPAGIVCVLFTDATGLAQNGWKIDNKSHHVQVPYTHANLNAHGKYSWKSLSKYNDHVLGLMKAKFYKMNAHLVPGLEQYDIILWMDAHFWLPGATWNPNLLDNVHSALQNSSILVPKHPARSTVASEVVPAGHRAEATTGHPGGVQDARQALQHARADGFKDDQGLYWCGTFAYNARDHRTRLAFSEWWRQIQLYSFRDQITFPYVTGKFKLNMTCPSASGMVELLQGHQSFRFLSMAKGHASEELQLYTNIASTNYMKDPRLLLAFPLLTIIAGAVYLFSMAGDGDAIQLLWPKLAEIMLASTVFFTSASGVIMLNRDILMQEGFTYPCFVGNLGAIGAFVFSHSMVYLGEWRLDTPMTGGILLKFALPMSLFGCIALWTGNAVYTYLSVSTIQIFKSNTVLLVFLLGCTQGLETWNVTKFAGVSLICLGLMTAIYSAFQPLTNNSKNGPMGFPGQPIFLGLLINMVSNSAEALRVTFVQLSLVKLSFQDALYWSSPMMLALNTFVILLAEGDVISADFSRMLLLKFLLSAALGCATTISSWWLTKLVGSLTVKVLAHLRNVLVVMIAVIWYADEFTPGEAFGYTIQLAGIVMHMRSKLEPIAKVPAKSYTEP